MNYGNLGSGRIKGVYKIDPLDASWTDIVKQYINDFQKC
jgi:hypothetical protein